MPASCSMPAGYTHYYNALQTIWSTSVLHWSTAPGGLKDSSPLP